MSVVVSFHCLHLICYLSHSPPYFLGSPPGVYCSVQSSLFLPHSFIQPSLLPMPHQSFRRWSPISKALSISHSLSLLLFSLSISCPLVDLVMRPRGVRAFLFLVCAIFASACSLCDQRHVLYTLNKAHTLPSSLPPPPLPTPSFFCTRNPKLQSPIIVISMTDIY